MSDSRHRKALVFPVTTLVIAFALSISLPSATHADVRHWRKITVPGAHCGDGSDYNILISDGDPKKLAFDLMGGGACWSEATCWGPEPHAWIHAIPGVWETGGIVSPEPDHSPLFDYTIVYFPYCTGDVHLGQHVAEYLPLTKVYHVGRTNVELSVRYLAEQKLVSFDDLDSFVFYGYSAGALGALYHVFNVEPLVRHARNKVLLADAPGLHFGPHFWDKFPAEWMRDVQDAMDAVGFKIDPHQGNLASLVPLICRKLPDWRVGVLQGSRDLIMSEVFGDISQDDHEKMIFGPKGLYSLTRERSDNCSSWVPVSAMHTFLATDPTSEIKAGEKTAMEYAADEILGPAGPNYRSPPERRR